MSSILVISPFVMEIFPKNCPFYKGIPIIAPVNFDTTRASDDYKGMKLIFARHTETDWNKIGRIQGVTDTHLNDKGRADAVILADRLREFNIDRIVPSSLARAKETAAIIGNVLGIDRIEPDGRLVECSHGKIDGMTHKEVKEKFQKDYVVAESARQEYDFGPFGGENRAQVLAREHALLTDLKNKYPAETVLLIGHGRAMNTLLGDLGIETELTRGNFLVLDR